MSFLSGMEISASGLRAQRMRMNVASSNMANVETTRTANGEGAYRRRQVSLSTAEVGATQQAFGSELEQAMRGVSVSAITPDETTPMRMEFDPGHPDADAEGYVEKPNVNMLEEVVDMMTSSRSYEANATAFDTLKKMAQRALQIGE
jgi:flagellar basal-body rod protein FlgC